jgi:glutamate/tyrosine decarboxylase-like PLP-dependent enzyme
MDATALRQQVEADVKNNLRPFLVVGSAGTTDTGAMDPLDAIADISERYDLWFHVDAAYGGFFILVDDLKDSFKGIERSDSVAIDPHKGMFLAYGLGAVLIKDVEAQFRSHYYRAAYMQDTLDANEELNPADLSPELTKHFRGMRFWLALQLLGLEPFKAGLEEKYWLCRYFYEEIEKAGFEVGPQPDLSVCIYRYVPESGDANEFNRLLTEYVQKDGTVFISSTTIDGVYWIRLAVLGFRSHLHTIDACLRILKEGVRYLKEKNAD